MYLNNQAIFTIEEIAKFDTKSNIVKSWAKKYCINEKTLAVIWRRAELLAAKGKKCKCIPWGTVTDIFKLSVRKHFKLEKCNRKDIKPAIIKGKYVKTHKDVEPGGALVRRYEAEIKQLEKDCPNFDKLSDCSKNLNESDLGKGLLAAGLTGLGVLGAMHFANEFAPTHEHPLSTHVNNVIGSKIDHPHLNAGKY